MQGRLQTILLTSLLKLVGCDEVDGDTVIVLLAMALLLGAALVLSFLHWKEWKARPTTLATARGARHNTSSNECAVSSRDGTRCQDPGLKKAKPLDGLLRDRPSLTPLNKLRNRFRRKLTPGEIRRLEQRSRTRL